MKAPISKELQEILNRYPDKSLDDLVKEGKIILYGTNGKRVKRLPDQA